MIAGMACATSWPYWSSRTGVAATAEVDSMTRDDTTQQSAREDNLESALRVVLAHPELSKEAFPDPVIRENILPFIMYLKRKSQGQTSDD